MKWKMLADPERNGRKLFVRSDLIETILPDEKEKGCWVTIKGSGPWLRSDMSAVELMGWIDQ